MIPSDGFCFLVIWKVYLIYLKHSIWSGQRWELLTLRARRSLETNDLFFSLDIWRCKRERSSSELPTFQLINTRSHLGSCLSLSLTWCFYFSFHFTLKWWNICRDKHSLWTWLSFAWPVIHALHTDPTTPALFHSVSVSLSCYKKKCHRLSGLNNQHLFFIDLEAGSPRSGQVHSKGSLSVV